ncbi:MAG: D-alanine--D-alanine ligase [Cyanobacteria bacterium REEB65]|nr:D-alanine--D-alanine ligase [Cyanobacteria bacterium REEB65]
MPDRVRVAVICGGSSSEREISLQSGRAMFKHLDPVRHEGKLIDLNDLLIGGSYPIERVVREFDVAFLALHGPGGEDGSLQGMLDLFGFPYTGSGVLASALAMNKPMAKRFYREAGLPVAREIVFSMVEVGKSSAAKASHQVQSKLGWPAVVKADSEGSTKGVQIVKDASAFEAAWSDAASYRSGVLVEEYIKGREFTVPIVGGSEPQALPLIEIVPKAGEFFTYEAKYSPGGSEEIVPAALDPGTTRSLQELGLRAHQVLGCWGLSRTDILVRDDGQPFVIETNTLPGMTEASLYPKAVLAAGWTLTQLVSALVDAAFERAELTGRFYAVPRMNRTLP